MPGLESLFQVNEINIILAIIGALISIFIIAYVHQYIKQKKILYYINNIVFIFSFILIIFTNNWLLFFTGWEFVTITTSIMLIWKNKGLMGQYFILQFVGSHILLMAILIAVNRGYNTIMPINQIWLQNLFIIGVGMKSSLIGFHLWLPSIYKQAPIIFNAVSSGWAVKLGFIFLLKIINSGNDLLFWAGIIMIILGGIRALTSLDAKVLLAYSSISQLGYIAIGIASGSKYGYIGSILFIIAHGLAKTGLFLSTENYIKENRSQIITDFKNAWEKHKLSSICIILSSASMMGLPFLPGFSSKYLIKYSFHNNILITVTLYVGSILTVLYTLRFIYIAIINDMIKNIKSADISNPADKKNIQISENIILILIGTFLLLIGINYKDVLIVISENTIKIKSVEGFIEILIYLVISIVILIKFDFLKGFNKKTYSLDDLFNKINKKLYHSGRYLNNLLYQDFQYQLLFIPLFLLLIFSYIYLI
ncbi:MAG: proton-conducting transporter membrane subunit [Bacillota bacterium]